MGRIFKILVGGFQKAKMQPVQLEFEGQIRTKQNAVGILKKRSRNPFVGYAAKLSATCANVYRYIRMVSS